jgi:RNA polymerase-binding protein DksA
MTAIDTVEFRSLLQVERDRLSAALEFLLAENPGTMQDEVRDVGGWGSDNHLADTASVTYDRELDEGLEEGTQQTIDQIDRALAKLDTGSFGTCERCGKPISEERLRARPWASLCIDDQRLADRG